MLNINEDDLKKAIVEKAAYQILQHDEELSGMVRAEVQRRVEKIFAERAAAQIQETIDQAIRTGFDMEYCRVNSWGQAEGEKTTIRKQLDASVQGYWTAKVDPRTGKPDSGSYGDKTTRAEYLMTQICAAGFSEEVKKHAVSVTAHLKDGLRGELANAMDRILNELFHVKSLQDQGKVPKPY